MTTIAIIGGGPAGYEAALVAVQYGADVTVVEQDGVGGACVLTDCVPSKAFIASAAGRTAVIGARELGLTVEADRVSVDVPTVNGRVNGLALAQSTDIRSQLETQGVTVVQGRAAFADRTPGLARHVVRIDPVDGESYDLDSDFVVVATGASPRVLPSARPDGERILTWRQVYALDELPEHLIVVGSGVTGAEFASAFTEMGVRVTLVSSRDRVLPSEDADAAAVIEKVFGEHGGELARQSRAESVQRDGDGVVVTLTDGRQIRGSHALMTVGAIPNTADIGLDRVGVDVNDQGFITVDRVSRTSAANVYAAGDCTGVLMLASVAAMQGRIAMWHALGEGVPPLALNTVSANVFTHPEIATVGDSQADAEQDPTGLQVLKLPLATNARAKMHGLDEGFVKLVIRPTTGLITGGVVVAPDASELILPIAMAVQNRLTVRNLAYTFSVYPSLSGSLTELARRLMFVTTGQL